MQTMARAAPVAEKAKVGTKVWIGRGISALVVAFMLFDVRPLVPSEYAASSS
jgi:hypothetical protein